ncbi:NAD(P)-dependent oxidoreductase [Kocuria varians]|uniref:NAD(P)-dependent oxidoreductase n=1 Tax=Kocuria varians TaxID=1272 RepID=A0A4Y4D520_KOCVA|nr:NmrA family NAD(P)-binding protein [Kocuria varians]GEC98653.1 NAD(P)-dependent oxidoreductase [Kocuria varians]
MTSTIGITGVTGHIGGAVSRALEEKGVAHRLLGRNPQRFDERVAASAGLLDSAPLDFADPEQTAESMTGLDTVFLVSAAETAEREAQQLAMVEALTKAGVKRVVYTSFASPSPKATFTFARTHYATEQAIERAGLEHTFLRDNFYLDVLPLFAGEDRVLRGPAGDGHVSAVARADVADAAVAVLLDPQTHSRGAYTLTGPESLTMTEVAEILTRVTGQTYRYEAETIDAAHESRAVLDPEPWEMEAWVSTYTAIASGELAEVTDDVRELTGHAPLSLEDVLRRH